MGFFRHPDIGYSAKMDRIEKAPGLKSYEVLNLIDFYVVPHYKNWERRQRILSTHILTA
ncbi:Type 1 glutamine amidotransferase-like domain-containing protein [Murimonas intestini]|uniref:Type 1 glutamine amidotransferase-like domain-containing protein n=1 Tax=Murimonas intestini TaxID=1337051 RepID=UPI003A7F2020